MKIVIFGLTISSAWGNGHATTFRSLIKALSIRGHAIVFIEKDVEWYRSHRDLPKPESCRLSLYEDWFSHQRMFLQECSDADAIVIGSYFPDALAAAQALLDAGCGPLIFYDIDTPVTVTALRSSVCEYLNLSLVSHYDAYLSFSGGPLLHKIQQEFGVRRVVPFYCSVDPDLYRPTASHKQFKCDLSYLGTYAPDRQTKLIDLLNEPASVLPDRSFLVAGAMYPEGSSWPGNVTRMTHVPPADHAAFYSSARFTLNLTRSDMVAAGYSPSVRLFEAAACGAAMLSDKWEGLCEFLLPGEQILLAESGQEVVEILCNLSESERVRIGKNARERILAEHTSSHRAVQLEEIVSGLGTTPERVQPKSQGINPA